MKSLITLAFLLASTPTFAQEAPAATELSVRQDVGLNVKAEALAIRELARVLRKEVQRGNLELTPEAAGRWEQGVALWEQASNRAKKESYHAAYTEVREIRRLMADTVMVAFDGEPNPRIRAALDGYFEAVSDRVTKARTYTVNHGLTGDAKACFTRGETAWTSARSMSAKGEYARAYATVLDGMDELDQMIRHVYEAKKS